MPFSTAILLSLTIPIILILHRFSHYIDIHLHLRHIPNATPLAHLIPSSFSAVFLTPRTRTPLSHPHRSSLLHAAHQRAPLLRAGPRTLSFSTPSAAAAIYGHATPCAKGPLYTALSPGHTNVLHAVDRGVHAAKRRRLAHGFSLRKAEQSWEAKVRGKVEAVVRALDVRAGGAVDFAQWANLFTVEAVADLVGSWRLGCLERGDDEVALGDRKLKYIASMRAGNRATAHAILWVPEWFGVVKPVLSVVSSFYRRQWREGKGYGELIKMLVKERIERAERGEVLDDMFRFMLEDKDGKPLGLDVEELEAEVGVMLDAGSDTTAIALANVMYFLLKNPSAFVRLRKELDESLPAGTVIPAYSSVMQLSYLRACLDESLRIIPPVSFGLSRITPPEGMNIDGHWIPGGTTVGVPAYTLHRDASIFPDPEAYRPERWLDDNTGGMNSAFIPFSSGARGCIGRNITSCI